MVCYWFKKLLFNYGNLLYNMPIDGVRMPWVMKMKILKTILMKLNTIKLTNEYKEVSIKIQLEPISETLI